MGTYTTVDQTVMRKHIFTARRNLRIKTVDRTAWQSFVSTLPESYAMSEVRHDFDSKLTQVILAYTARGANAHDIATRLASSNLSFVDDGAGPRTRDCTCSMTITGEATCVDPT